MILRPTTRLHLHKWEVATTTSISRVKSPRFLKRYFQQGTAEAGCGFHWHIFNSLEVEHYKNQKCTAILYVLHANWFRQAKSEKYTMMVESASKWILSSNIMHQLTLVYKVYWWAVKKIFEATGKNIVPWWPDYFCTSEKLLGFNNGTEKTLTNIYKKQHT